jgi:hypothetical protein
MSHRRRRRASFRPIVLTVTGLAAGGALVLSSTAAGATGFDVVGTPQCGRIVEWTITNRDDWTVVITDGDLDLPALGASETVTVVQDYSGTADEYAYFTVVGYIDGMPEDDPYYQPDENGHVPWVEGQTVAISNEECAPPPTEPPTTEPPTTQPPTTQPPVTEPPTTQPPVTEPPTTEGPTTATAAVQPQAVVADPVPAPEPAPEPTGGSLAFTGSDDVTLAVVGAAMVGLGTALVRLRRRLARAS